MNGPLQSIRQKRESKKFRALLKESRKQLGATPKEMADYLHFSYYNYQRMEKGSFTPHVSARKQAENKIEELVKNQK